MFDNGIFGIGHLGMGGASGPAVDGPGFIWVLGIGWVWVPGWVPPGMVHGGVGRIPLGYPPIVGDPRIDGGWRPQTSHPALTFMDALHESLEDKSEEALHQALSTPENTATIARLYKGNSKGTSTQALRQELARLQAELRNPGANKPAIVRAIREILEQLNE
jgi:hypothetical protein